MLVSAKEMLEKAKAGHYAVGQFNINNLEYHRSGGSALRSRQLRGLHEMYRGRILIHHV